MKKSQILLYICIILSLINIFMIVMDSFHRNTTVSEESTPSFKTGTDGCSDIFMPDETDLAGENVPLGRQDIQEALKKELIVNTYLHSHSIQILKNAPRIFARIEPILKAKGIPEDFKYLAVIESRLNPSAVSPSGATGLWQIMKNTAKELGLEVNDEVDERYHIEKSTAAAADYLKKAHEKFGSWTLAAASYNAGTAMLSKQMALQKENNYYNLLLGEETGRYVFRILALKQIMQQPERYHFNVKATYPKEPTMEVKVTGSIKNWTDFARQHGITYKTLKRFNPWLRKTNLKNSRRKDYFIRIPVRKGQY